MLRYTVNRLLSAAPLIAIVALGTFGLVFLVPGDPARMIAGEDASADRIAQVRDRLGLDDSFFEQFWHWFNNLAHGDLGVSLVYNVPVNDIMWQRVPVTLSLVAVGLVLATLIGVPIGMLAGARPGSRLDRILMGFTGLGLAIPAFWIAMLLIIVFSLNANILPATGYVPMSAGIVGWAQSMVLPGLAIAAASAADIARQTRASYADVLKLDHSRTSRAMGLPRRTLFLKHALRNSGVPIVTVMGLQVERLISAAVVIELMFAMPGLGQFTVESVRAQDLPAIQGVVVVIAVMVILTNLLVDLSYALINPRLRKALA